MERRIVRLLLIEDDPEYVVAIRDSFTAATPTAHFAIEVATSLHEGLAAAAQSPPDAVLLDLSLPDCQGLDTFQRLRSAHPDLPIVVLSGFDAETIALEAVRKGAQDYIVKKNLNGKLLVRTVLYAMERQRVRRKIDRLV